MDLTLHLYNLILLSSVLSAISTGCSLKDVVDECSFTVECEGHVTTVKQSRFCLKTPNATFIIRDSITHNLEKDFFEDTNFNYKVRIIRAINNIWTNISSYTFTYYRKCTTMDLSSNGIKNIENNAFGNMLRLNFLNLSGNAVELLNEYSLRTSRTKCTLTNLDLSYNLLTHISSDQLHYMKSLSYLAIHHNRLQTVSPGCFSELQSLNNLDLKHNQLTTLNNAIADLKSLYYLDVSCNNLIELSEYEFNQTTHLKYVNLSNNAIEVIGSNCFAHALDLERLDLSNNKITSTIDGDFFMDNSQLQAIYLSNNSIQCIHDAFKHNPKLNIKVLEPNPLRKKIEELFCDPNYITMTRIQLNDQNITAIENGMFPELTNLVYLNLSKNFIHTIDSNAFPNFYSLIILDISYNSLSNLDFFKNSLENLTELYLNNNNITIIIKDTFLDQINLVKLDLSMNYIKIIEQFSLPLVKLEYLNLTGNKVAGIFKSNVVCPSKHLRFLDLSGSSLTKIGNGAFVDCPSLTKVNLSRNIIEDIGPDNFNNMDSLYSLDLSYNDLSTLKLKHLFLRHLNMSSNLILDNIFKNLNLNLIQSIDLSRNYLQVLDEQSLYNCNLLESLIIDHNYVTKIDVKKMLKTLPYLKSLSLIGNPIACAEIVEEHEVRSISVDKIFEGDNLRKLRLQCDNDNVILGTLNDTKIENTTPTVGDVPSTPTTLRLPTTMTVPLLSSYTIDSVSNANTYNITNANTYTVTDANIYTVTDSDTYTVTAVGNKATVRHVTQPKNSFPLLIHVLLGCAVLVTPMVVVGGCWCFYKRKRVYDLNAPRSNGMTTVELNR